jgi:sulfonate transport system substrate-binding protein
MLIKLASTQILGILSYCHQTVLSQRTRSLALLFATGLGLSLVVAACSPTATTQETVTANTYAPPKSVTVSIGYQKSATVLNALKTKGDLEKALAGC